MQLRTWRKLKSCFLEASENIFPNILYLWLSKSPNTKSTNKEEPLIHGLSVIELNGKGLNMLLLDTIRSTEVFKMQNSVYEKPTDSSRKMEETYLPFFSHKVQLCSLGIRKQNRSKMPLKWGMTDLLGTIRLSKQQDRDFLSFLFASYI